MSFILVILEISSLTSPRSNFSFQRSKMVEHKILDELF